MRYFSSISLIIFRLKVTFVFAIFVLAIACSSNGPEPTEAGLIQRSQMANDALNTQNWSGIYQLYPPEVRDICSLDAFESGWNSNYEEQFGALLEMLGPDTELKLVVETNSVAITGIEAYVTLELDAFTSDAQPVIENLVNESAQLWKFVDGDWYIGEDIPEDFC